MFQLAEIRHMVRIPPWLFGQTLNDAVIEELNRKLANKVRQFLNVMTLTSFSSVPEKKKMQKG